MTAFLKIDECKTCRRSLPWEWVPAVRLNGRALAGTGVWRSQLIASQCPSCLAAVEVEHAKQQHALARRRELVELLGGEKPCRDFTFEGYQVAPGNRLAYERSRHFNPAIENLYLWGACGVGKTHLAYAAARRCFEETLAVAILPMYQLSRRVRMKEPAQEQDAINQLVQVEVLVLDELDIESAYTLRLLHEILDGRDFANRAGLVVTSQYKLGELAARLNDDAIPSRLAGMCRLIHITGADHRLERRGTAAQDQSTEGAPLP